MLFKYFKSAFNKKKLLAVFLTDFKCILGVSLTKYEEIEMLYAECSSINTGLLHTHICIVNDFVSWDGLSLSERFLITVIHHPSLPPELTPGPMNHSPFVILPELFNCFRAALLRKLLPRGRLRSFIRLLRAIRKRENL